MRPGTLCVVECMAFRELFRQWPESTRQHDAGEFWQHLRQARLSNPFSIVDSGTLAGLSLTYAHAQLVAADDHYMAASICSAWSGSAAGTLRVPSALQIHC